MEDLTQMGTVELSHTDGIGYLTFAHPAHNAMPGAQLARLVAAIDQAGADPHIKVIILRSGGERTFCAGASFDELAAIADFAAAEQFFMGFAQVINAMRRCPKFILGRIQGKAVGGGVGLAAAVDYCAATRQADVKLSELAVGIGPFVVGPAVARKVGQAAFQQLAIDAASWQSADWALRHGLYQELFDTPDDLDAHLHALATRLAASSPEAMRRLKAVAWEDAAHWDELLPQRAAISGELVLTEPARAAIARFKAKS